MTAAAATGPVDLFGPDSPFKTPFHKHLMRTLIDSVWVHPKESVAIEHNAYHAVFTAFAAFAPRDPIEEMLAVQAIGAHNAVMECLRRAMLPELSPVIGERLRAGAASMGRMMRETMRLLRFSQSGPLPVTALQREKREAARKAHASQMANAGEHPMRPEEAVVQRAGVEEPRQEPMRREESGVQRTAVETQRQDPVRPEEPAVQRAAAETPRKDSMRPEEATVQRAAPEAPSQNPVQSGEPAAPAPKQHPLMGKIPNGEPVRDFLSRHFGPNEDVEAAWAQAQREQADLDAARDAAAAKEARHQAARGADKPV